MKSIFLFFAGLFLSAAAIKAQTVNPFSRTIAVTGSAEIELVPDEIYVNIVLREYVRKGNTKVDLEKIKAGFRDAARKAGLADSLISIAAYEGFDPLAWKRKKKETPDLLASITYQVKFRNAPQMDALVETLDDEATQSFHIVRVAHSRMEEYRKTLKMEAIRAAKAKAEYLAGAIGEKIGVAVTLEEPREFGIPYPVPVMSNTMMRNEVSMDASAGVAEPLDFRKLKLRMEVGATFALQS
ncbi:MAG TPA: SIMPL domain-containing protein [Chitinophagaceae bacterium]|nr:SIMPL domain-containing protein [Chitinophagaceae bacterium]